LENLFSRYGEIVHLKLPRKPDGQLRGMALVTYTSSEEAIRAFSEMDNRIFFGRIFHVKPAYKSPITIKYNQNNKKKYMN